MRFLSSTPRFVALAALATTVVGCSASVHVSLGGATVDNPDSLVSDALFHAVGQHPRAVTCPANVPAHAGHVFHCRVTINAAGQYLIATVTETSVSASKVHLHVADGTKVYSPG